MSEHTLRLVKIYKPIQKACQRPDIASTPYPQRVFTLCQLPLNASLWKPSSAKHPQVERILCGHLHRPITRHFGGPVARTAPSTAHQITLGLTPDSPPAFVFESPGFYVHTVQAGQLVTHLQPVGDFGAPQRFR